jgi:type VI secretion system protein ImpF
MAELTSTERLQPCLLDRLTDLEPDKSERRSDRVISMAKYREGVLRDLVWLMSTGRHPDSEGLADFPEVEKSVLNFGTRNLCGVLSEDLGVRGYEAELERAIEWFEPRVNSSSLKVGRRDKDVAYEKHVLEFEIRGDLWAYPMPEQLWLQTKVDLETGNLTLDKK